MKKASQFLTGAFMVSIAAGVVILVNSMQRGRIGNQNGMICSEEPFGGLEMPLRDVDASVACSSGDVVTGKNAVVIRVLDGRNVVRYFAILNDGYKGGYRSVLKNLPLSWSAEYGVGEIVDSEGVCPIPEVFFTDERFERAKDARSAIRNLMRILETGRGMNGGRPEFAIQVLKNGLAEAD